MAAVNAGWVKQVARGLERKAKGSNPASPQRKNRDVEADKDKETKGEDGAMQKRKRI